MSWLDRRLRDLRGSSWHQSRLCWDGLEVVSEETIALSVCLVEFVGHNRNCLNGEFRSYTGSETNSDLVPRLRSPESAVGIEFTKLC